jgi:[ribosomal protein S5]-alanine N-acetyltransferase
VHALPVLTPSLILRQFSVEDASTILTLNAEPSTRRWLPSHVYANLADAREAMEFLVSCYTEPGHPQRGPYVLAVAHRRSAALLGHVGFSPLDEEAEISYAIAESERGHGLGVEAVDHACTWVQRNFKLQRVIAVTSVENAASRRLLAKAKFRFQRGESMRFQGTEQQVARYIREMVPSSLA